ncbi:MAG: hypothetical protein AB7I09_20425 [Planctomycetota bacterium]
MTSILRAICRIRPERLGRQGQSLVERSAGLGRIADRPRPHRCARLVLATSAYFEGLSEALLTLEAAFEHGFSTLAECVDRRDEFARILRSRLGLPIEEILDPLQKVAIEPHEPMRVSVAEVLARLSNFSGRAVATVPVVALERIGHELGLDSASSRLRRAVEQIQASLQRTAAHPLRLLPGLGAAYSAGRWTAPEVAEALRVDVPACLWLLQEHGFALTLDRVR